MERGRRIPLHDHSSRWEGGRIAGHAIVTATGGDSSPIGGGGGGTGGPTTAAGVSLADAPGNYAADNVEDAFAEVAGDLAAIEAEIADLGNAEAEGTAFLTDRVPLPGFELQTVIEAMAREQGWTVDSAGTLTHTGTPTDAINDATWNEFPGAALLDSRRVLVVFRGNGTGHTVGGEVCGSIWTLNDTRDAITAVGAKFTIATDTDDLRVEDAVTIVRDEFDRRRLVIVYRPYDGSDNHDPVFIICDDEAQDFTETSTWGSPISIPLTTGSANNKSDGTIIRTADGAWYVPVEYDNSNTDRYVGIWRWTGTLDDPSGGSFILIGHDNTKHYSELAVQPLDDDGNMLALLRCDALSSTRKAFSTDYGATWGAISDAHDGHGHPTFRVLQSGLILTVYRDSPNGDTAWRVSTDGGVTFGSETILDTTGTRSAYASILEVRSNAILVPFGIEWSSDGSTGTADVRYTWFTGTATFMATGSAGEPEAEAHIADTTDAHDASAISFDATGLTYTDADDVQEAIADHDAQLATLAASSAGTIGHVHVAYETHTADGSTTTFVLDQMYEPGSVMAWNRSAGTLLGVTEVLPDSATISAAGSAGNLIDFFYAASVI